MQDLNFFMLTKSHYDGSYSFHFIGPASVSEEQFKSICDGLLDDSALLALTNSVEQVKKWNEEEPDNEGFGGYLGSYVGWGDIVEAMIPLLEEKGFKHFKPKEVCYVGGEIIDSRPNSSNGSVLPEKSNEKVINHNMQISNAHYAKYE